MFTNIKSCSKFMFVTFMSGYWVPILVAFMTCIVCSGTILFLGHHMGNCVMCITTQNSEDPVLNIPSPQCNSFSVFNIKSWRK